MLDGEWLFALDKEDKGLEGRWFLGHQYKYSGSWPGSTEEHMEEARIDPEQKKWTDKIIAWYERDFPLPLLTDMDAPSSLIQLTFGACGYETRVWLNGILLKTIEGEEVHVREYTSFYYELNPDLLRENNRLTVRIADTMDADIPRGKQESYVYKRGGIWYQTYTGAVRSVWLEIVERNRLRSRLGVVSVVEDKLACFNLTTRIHDRGRYRFCLKLYNCWQETDAPVATNEFPLLLEAGESRQRVVVEIYQTTCINHKPWS